MGQGTESCGGYDVDYDEYDDALAGDYWIQRDGSRIRISDMSDRHLRNTARICHNLACRATFESEANKWLAWAEIMSDELASRVASPEKSKAANPPAPVRGAKAQMVCHCGKPYEAREADLKRGWGLSCSKSCAASRKTFRLPAEKKVE